ncbi:hypothetical protein BN1013_01843 [Candidatus Rubidus massiliensis]|nr:hypothetical protein BN1013_01843 [Candidatus Rubidus massiliensis]
MKKQPNKIQMDNKYRVCLGSFLSKEEENILALFVFHARRMVKLY